MKKASEYLQGAYSKIRQEQSSKHEDVCQPILKAMEEYAQQNAIEFSKWVEDDFCIVTFDEDEHENLYEAYLPRKYPVKDAYYLKELYQIWKHEILQDENTKI